MVEDAEFASFDLVAVTGDVLDANSAETAAHIGDSCDSEAVSLALVADETAKTELQKLTRSFGIVVVVETDRWIQELLTDLSTLYSQSMMLHTDYTRINANLKQGSVASVCRVTGDREELEDVVESSWRTAWKIALVLFKRAAAR